MRTLLAALVLPLSLAACGGGSDAKSIDWGSFDADTQAHIEELVAAKDCEGMQASFDVADAKGESGVMSYLDDAMESAGCYK